MSRSQTLFAREVCPIKRSQTLFAREVCPIKRSQILFTIYKAAAIQSSAEIHKLEWVMMPWPGNEFVYLSHVIRKVGRPYIKGADKLQ